MQSGSTGVLIKKGIWAAARQAVENGATYPEVCKRFGLKLSTLRNKSFREQWDSVHRKLKNGNKATPFEGAPDFSERDACSQNAQNSGIRGITEFCSDEALIPDRRTLRDAAREGREPFRKALQDVARTALAESVAMIPLPRTMGEWKQMVEILDKAEKMGGPTRDSRAIRHASRLSRTPIDVEPEPEIDGFRI